MSEKPPNAEPPTTERKQRGPALNISGLTEEDKKFYALVSVIRDINYKQFYKDTNDRHTALWELTDSIPPEEAAKRALLKQLAEAHDIRASRFLLEDFRVLKSYLEFDREQFTPEELEEMESKLREVLNLFDSAPRGKGKRK